MNLHRSPRWGHSNTFSHFFSDAPLQQIDYAKGLAAFGVFLILLVVIWLTILLLFKVIMAGRGNSWIAGGSVIDVQEIKKNQRHLKPMLQQMVKRSWRIQTCFLILSLLLPVATGFFIKKGLDTFVDAIVEIQGTNQNVEHVLAKGIGIVTSLTRERDRIHKLKDLFDIDRLCPLVGVINNNSNNSNNSNTSSSSSSSLFSNISFADINSHLFTTFDDMDRLVDENVVYAEQGLHAIKDVTVSVDTAVDIIVASDWIPKMYMMVLMVINIFLLAGVVLNRQNIIFFPFKSMLVWLLVPAFILLLVIATVGTSAIGVLASVNADFCAGGDSESPRGTLEDIIKSHSSSTTDLSYRSFEYYMTVRYSGGFAFGPISIMLTLTLFLYCHTGLYN